LAKWYNYGLCSRICKNDKRKYKSHFYCLKLNIITTDMLDYAITIGDSVTKSKEFFHILVMCIVCWCSISKFICFSKFKVVFC
jgi:hypothetical protein